METLDDLAHAIDRASDAGDEAALRRIGKDCESRLSTADSEDRVRLLYYCSNTYSSIIAIKQNEADYVWNWKQPEGVQNILLLRQALREPSFDTVDPIFARQIRTNLANRLHAIGRPVAANEERLQVLEYDPFFAKALAGKARGIASYAKQLYDQNHISILLAAARSLFDEALGEDAFWKSGDRNSVAVPPIYSVRRRNTGFSGRCPIALVACTRSCFRAFSRAFAVAPCDSPGSSRFAINGTSFGATSQASRQGTQNTRISAPDGINGRDRRCKGGESWRLSKSSEASRAPENQRKPIAPGPSHTIPAILRAAAMTIRRNLRCMLGYRHYAHVGTLPVALPPVSSHRRRSFDAMWA